MRRPDGNLTTGVVGQRMAPPRTHIPENLLAEIGTALIIRAVEQQLLDLYAEGHIAGTIHTCVGQEWTGVAVARALRPGDQVLSNHRCHGHYLSWTDDVEGLIAEIMGRATGVCGGRGGSQHLCGKGFFSSGILGGTSPVAAGLALAHKMKGSGNIVALFIGDGAFGEGVVYETMNVASALALPLYIMCEDNGVAQSTTTRDVLPGEFLARASAFDIDVFHSDTWDFERLVEDVEQAVNMVRRNIRPAFHLVKTFRLNPHSKGDDNRARELLDDYWRRDPLSRLLATGDERIVELDQAATRRVDQAVAAALEAPAGSVNQLDSSAVSNRNVPLRPARLGEGRIVDQIRQGLKRAMERDERVVLLGQDIVSPYGGAFKVTKGLSDQFPTRVRNMPVSEAAIVGTGTGLALGGIRPIVEIMFGDFLTLAIDQLLNHAAKFRFMSADKVRVPLIVRTPMGGRRGYGPTHSQSLEKHLLGVPDLSVLAVHHRLDATRFYESLIATVEDPHLVIENKTVYGTDGQKGIVEGFNYLETDELFPTLIVRPSSPAAVTVLCYGGNLIEVEKALDILFYEYEVLAECVCPTSLYPLNIRPIESSVCSTGRLLVIEEGYAFCGFGAEVVATLHERLGAGFLCRRLAATPHPIPAAPAAEAAQLPAAADVVSNALDLVR